MQKNSESADRRFTVEEANAMLPLVRSIVEDICDVFQRVTRRRSDLHKMLRGKSKVTGPFFDDETAESRADLQEEYDQIWEYREELEALGAFLRNPEDGQVEFPAEILNQSCFLCWQRGDAAVTYYRLADSASTERLLLPALQDAP